MKVALSKTLEQVEIQEAISHGALRMFALTGGPSEEDGLTLLEDSLEAGSFRLEELGEGGSVPELRVINGGSTAVLVLEGDELVGGKQNRVVNSSVLIAADSELILPVSCVERGRWSRRSRTVSSGCATPHLSLRHLKSRSVHDSLKRGRGHRSDQGAVWEEVDRLSNVYDSPSPTDALQDARAGLSERLAAFDDLLKRLQGNARGVVVAIGDRPVALEILAGPRSFAKALPKLLAGYALEALEHRGNGERPDVPTAEEFISCIAAAHQEQHAAVGDGTEVRLTGRGLSGYALCGNGSVLHAAAFQAWQANGHE
jgi:hypothetical protein